ncbi:MAG: tetratricopeptide repeat protein, partial [Thermodesulfobacteriota bacterium]
FTSVLLHALNSALVFIVAIKLSGGEKNRGAGAAAALAAALLFAVHPLHVESVAWVSERKDVLSAFFFLLAILTYLNYTEKAEKTLSYCLTLLFFLLALMSKPMAVTLPAVLLILDYYPLKREAAGWAKPVIEKIPFFVLSSASVIITIWAQSIGGGLRGLETHSISTRIYISVRAVTFYLQKLIIPTDLSPYYPLPFSTSLASKAFAGSLIFIILITILCLLAGKKGKRWPLALWLFYLITLLPASGLVSVGGQAAADRYAYIPTMGFFLLTGALISKVAGKRSGEGKAALRDHAGTAAILIILLAILTTATLKQERFWRGTIPLMSHAITLYPDRAAIPYNNRGLAYERAGKLRLALADYNRAIAISRDFSEALINRGIVYGRSALFTRAIEDFSRALAIDPADAKAYMNRGAAYMSLGDYSRALSDLKHGTALDPQDAAAHYNLGLVYFNTGNRREALKNMKKAAALGLAEAGEFIRREGLY